MRRKALAIAVMAAVLFAVWSVVLKNGFVYDDHKYIVENPWIKDPVFIADIFSSSTSGFSPLEAPSNTYRPMLYMLYMAEYLSFGLAPHYFHLVNLAAHVLNAALVFLIALFLLEKNGCRALLPALLGGLAFGLHTINSEAVNWVSASTELFFTLFVLTGLYLYITRSSGVISALFFFLALLFKETAAALPIVMLSYDLATGSSVRAKWKAYAVLIFAGAAYGLLRFNAVGGVMHHKQIEFGLLESIINIFPLIAAYAGKLVFPAGLSAIYEFRAVTTLLDLRVLAGALVALCFIAAMFFAGKRPVFLTGLAMLAAPVLPVLYVPALSSSAMADRYLYLPSAGLALILAALLSTLDGRALKASVAVFAAVLVAWAGGAVARSQAWRSDITLWQDAVAKAPGAPNAHYNYAWASHNAGRLDVALEHYRAATRLVPSADAHFNIGVIFMNQSMMDEAEAEFRAALSIDPAFDGARMKLIEVQRLRRAGA